RGEAEPLGSCLGEFSLAPTTWYAVRCKCRPYRTVRSMVPRPYAPPAMTRGLGIKNPLPMQAAWRGDSCSAGITAQ
ncbi:MAG TPA: hypothetical protein PKV95_07680, partial [Anaerolineaceae bacterium]|nr:hypothetical protein [Anaerolineaceae bacterium]